MFFISQIKLSPKVNWLFFFKIVIFVCLFWWYGVPVLRFHAVCVRGLILGWSLFLAQSEHPLVVSPSSALDLHMCKQVI